MDGGVKIEIYITPSLLGVSLWPANTWLRRHECQGMQLHESIHGVILFSTKLGHTSSTMNPGQLIIMFMNVMKLGSYI